MTIVGNAGENYAVDWRMRKRPDGWKIVDVIVAGSADAIMMVEGGALEVPEEEIAEGLTVAHMGIKELIAIQNEREWAAFCEVVLRQPGLASEERFSSNFRRNAARDEVRGIIVEAFSALTTSQPAALRASSCMPRSWSPVETRA